MGTLIASYLIGWAAVSAYVGRLAVLSRRLARRMKQLHALVREQDESTLSNAR